METKKIRENGNALLKSITSELKQLKAIRNELWEYKFKSTNCDDPFSWLTCILALKAVSLGNLGIGCLLVNPNDEVLIEGHNKVFKPYFRSDQHAEMVVMNEFEKKFSNTTCLAGYKMYTSLESCPMCLTRLIISGISEVYHIASDPLGGMVQQMDTMPPIWLDLASGKTFGKASCSNELMTLSDRIFSLNREDLDAIIKKRQSHTN